MIECGEIFWFFDGEDDILGGDEDVYVVVGFGEILFQIDVFCLVFGNCQVFVFQMVVDCGVEEGGWFYVFWYWVCVIKNCIGIVLCYDVFGGY